MPFSPVGDTTDWWRHLEGEGAGHRLCRGCGRSRGLPPQPGAPRVKFLVHFGGGELSRALKAVDEHAVGTCELSPCENLDETERLAREKGAGGGPGAGKGNREGGAAVSERLRIALTKGRLQDQSVELFEAMGLDCTPVCHPGRRLVHAIQLSAGRGAGQGPRRHHLCGARGL